MKDSEVLRKVQKLIKNRKESYICYAITTVCGYTPQGGSLKRWVMKMLKGSATYDQWLHKRNGYFPMVGQGRQGRLAWLDWMIEYCEAEEAKK
jgi:hypothetical protein